MDSLYYLFIYMLLGGSLSLLAGVDFGEVTSRTKLSRADYHIIFCAFSADLIHGSDSRGCGTFIVQAKGNMT